MKGKPAFLLKTHQGQKTHKIHQGQKTHQTHQGHKTHKIHQGQKTHQTQQGHQNHQTLKGMPAFLLRTKDTTNSKGKMFLVQVQGRKKKKTKDTTNASNDYSSGAVCDMKPDSWSHKKARENTEKLFHLYKTYSLEEYEEFIRKFGRDKLVKLLFGGYQQSPIGIQNVFTPFEMKDF